MEKSEISIATMTWARDAQEEHLLRESLSHLAELNIPTFVTDGGSGKGFIEFLQGFSHFKVFEADEPGLWPQVRRSIQAANESAAQFILYTEPDKSEFFRGNLQKLISEAPGGDDLGVVIAGRSAASFSTFPEFQRFTEAAINRCCAEVIGEPGDYTYGPFLLNRGLVPYLNDVVKDLAWGWRPYAFKIARRRGYRIEFLVKDLPCPLQQQEDSKSERIYRMSQLSQSIEGLVLSTTVAVAPA
jgi:hypothetical protein